LRILCMDGRASDCPPASSLDETSFGCEPATSE
jgi:hypothetical protein